MVPWFRTFSVDTKAQNPVMLLNDSAFTAYNNSAATVADLDLDDPNHVIMPLFAGHIDYVSRDLYKVDVTTGKAEVMLQGKAIRAGLENTIYWIMDGHGHAIGRVDQIEEPLVDHLKLYKDGNWQEVAAYDAEADLGASVAGLSTDGKVLIRFERSEKTGTEGLVSYDIATGATTPLFDDPTYDVAGLEVDDWTRRVVGASYTTDTHQYHYFDPAMQALQKGLQAAFPGNNVAVTSWNQALDKVIAAVWSTSNPPTYYLLDRKTHFAGRIGTAYPKLTASDLGVVKPYPYKARDGLDIPAYLTLPPGKTPKNLPVVVMPHGGPEARDAMDFDWWAQFLANRGYAVLQPNFRGSSGYGYAFRRAGFHQWGLKMQDDITDGVQKLVADGIADPKRICIVGASYGGYAALAGAVFTPNLYACAVSYAGVSDLPKLLGTALDESGPHSKTMSYLNSRVGNTSDDLVRLKATSPALHADQVKCPILLMHGDGDWTVRIVQSEEMYDKLLAAGKTVDFIRFKGDEDHYLERADTRIQMLTEIEKFLAKNIGN
jgi:dipeptidyl aminopeptidase/acylaminoacyl peptidase